MVQLNVNDMLRSAAADVFATVNAKLEAAIPIAPTAVVVTKSTPWTRNEKLETRPAAAAAPPFTMMMESVPSDQTTAEPVAVARPARLRELVKLDRVEATQTFATEVVVFQLAAVMALAIPAPLEMFSMRMTSPVPPEITALMLNWDLVELATVELTAA